MPKTAKHHGERQEIRLPKELKDKMNRLVPAQERAAFIRQAIEAALKRPNAR